MISGCLTKDELALINENVKYQTDYNIDTVINDLKLKWDSEIYYYDEKEARKFYSFISKLELDRGEKGSKIKLLRFQFEICTEILFVKNKETNLRKHQKCLLDIARKNSKGTIVSVIITYLFFTDKTFGAEYIIVANDQKQAMNLFSTIQLMIENNKVLKKYVKITESRKLMYRKATNSKLRVLANNGIGLDSYPTYILVTDEAHEYRNQDAYIKLRTGMGLWDEPLWLCTTTASSGQDPHNLEMETYTYAKDVSNGKYVDEKFYSKIFEAEKDCNLLDVAQWIKSNPALGSFRKVDDLKDFLVQATRLKSQEAKARRLYLNQHVAIDGENAIDMNEWRDCVKEIDLNSLRGMTCWAALDMAFIKDIIAYVQVFYDDDNDKFIVYPHLFSPKETIHARSEKDSVRYDLYAQKGELQLLNGYYVNNEELFNYITDINNKYQFDTQEICFDSWGSGDIRSRLEQDYTIFPFGQGYKSMSPAIKDFEIMLLDKRVVIANNSLLTWMASNVVAAYDPSGNIKYDKSKSKYKIDGIIAMVMALARARYNNDGAQYDALEQLNKLDW